MLIRSASLASLFVLGSVVLVGCGSSSSGGDTSAAGASSGAAAGATSTGGTGGSGASGSAGKAAGGVGGTGSSGTAGAGGNAAGGTGGSAGSGTAGNATGASAGAAGNGAVSGAGGASGNGASAGSGGASAGAGGGGEGGSAGAGGAGGMSGAGGATFPCSPKAACAASAECLGLVENAGQPNFGLRMAQLSLTKPSALATGIVHNTVAGAVEPSLPACNSQGTATFNWLLELDTTKMTLETGGAKPVMDPAQGYTFENDMLGSEMVMPATLPLSSMSGGAFSTTGPANVILPVYMDAAGSSALFTLPLEQLSISGTLSADQDCIGTYNAAGLDPNNSCLPDSTTPEFLDAGTVSAVIVLEEADSVVIPVLQESLCALLGGQDASDGAQPVAHCKRDAGGKIVFQGDACSQAGGNCTDALSFDGGFSASAIKIDG